MDRHVHYSMFPWRGEGTPCILSGMRLLLCLALLGSCVSGPAQAGKLDLYDGFERFAPPPAARRADAPPWAGGTWRPGDPAAFRSEAREVQMAGRTMNLGLAVAGAVGMASVWPVGAAGFAAVALVNAASLWSLSRDRSAPKGRWDLLCSQ